MNFSKERFQELAGISNKLIERSSPEFNQDLVAYLSNIDTDSIESENKFKKRKDKHESGIGTADVVDGPYTKLVKNQPFDYDAAQDKKDFLKALHISEALIEPKQRENKVSFQKERLLKLAGLQDR